MPVPRSKKSRGGDFGIACTAFLDGWSIAAITLPKVNEFLLKKLAPLLCGDKEYMICSAITEPHAGGSVEDMRLQGSQIKTTARLEGNRWIINGHKRWPLCLQRGKMFRVLCAVEGQRLPKKYCPNICAGGCARGDNEHPLPNDGGQR